MSKKERKNKKTNDILGIINKIFDFNKEIQKQRDLGLKILTENKCLIDYQLLQLNQKQEAILKHLQTKLGKFYILCADQKNLQNNSTEA